MLAEKDSAKLLDAGGWVFGNRVEDGLAFGDGEREHQCNRTTAARRVGRDGRRGRSGVQSRIW
jgi:hypothetical protein